MPSTEVLGQRSAHEVLVYDDPLQLVRTIGEHTLDALCRGGAVVLLAHHDHVEAAGEWVRLSGALGRSEGSPHHDGRYQTFDVDDVIRDIGLVTNPTGALEELLAAACARVPVGVEVVHIFGNLVGTLWERGRTRLALDIEGLGGRLATERGISVLCAYPAAALDVPGSLASVQHCHTGVVRLGRVPPATYSFGASNPGESGRPVDDRGTVTHTKVFPPSVPACRAARRFVRAMVEAAGGDGEVADAAELICSELAANAVRHAHSVFSVRVVCGDGGVRIAVADEARPSEATPDAGEGQPYPVRTARGLGIVSALSADWGIDEQAPGKVVWAEVGPIRGAA